MRLIERLRLVDRDMTGIAPERWTDAGRAARIVVALDEALAGLRRGARRHLLELRVSARGAIGQVRLRRRKAQRHARHAARDARRGGDVKVNPDWYRKQAKALLRLIGAGDAATLARFRAVWRDESTPPTLMRAQHVVAVEGGFAKWGDMLAAETT